jgi:hypothetical protein
MPTTKLKLNIAHQVPGRIRLKIPAAKGNAELLRQISETFGIIPGIEQITVNPTTGSVIMHYDVDRHREFHDRFQAMPQIARPPSTEFDQMAVRIEEEAEFLAQHSKTARAVVDFCKQLDREIKRATDNNVDLTIVLALGVIGFTIFEVGATAATPVWVTLTLFALNHYVEMHAAAAGAGPTSAPVIVKG